MSKPCTVCGRVSGSARCSLHPKPRGASSPIHSDPRWTRLSRRMIARHVGQFGWVCPGDEAEHPAHPVAPGQLTTDHLIPLDDGGAPFDPANTRILCKSWNSTLGARLVNAKRAGRAVVEMYALAGAPSGVKDQARKVFEDARAQIRARYL